MWYRTAQLYDVDGKDLLNFGPFVMPKPANAVAYTGVPAGFKSTMQASDRQWSTVTWSEPAGLQFWSSNGKLIGAQPKGADIFTTLRTVEPFRFKSDFTDKVLLDIYRQGKHAEQQMLAVRQQNPQGLTPQVANQILARYMANYRTQPKVDAEGKLTNPSEYYPQSDDTTDAKVRENLEREYLAAPKNAKEQGFQFTDAAPTETGSQYRARYTEAYAKAYAEYETNGRRMPFAQWKKQFDDAFSKGQYGSAGQPIVPSSNQATTQNQAAGTYKMQQDAAGNVHIVQADGRAYAYIPVEQVQYQLNYIKKMTGKTPQTKTQPVTPQAAQ